MRVALAPLNPTVGDVDANADLASKAIARARDLAADLVVLPELCLSGYPPKDLLLRPRFVRACADAARRVGLAAPRGITCVLGTPLPVDHGSAGVSNSLLVYRDGRELETYDKQLLPTYDVFDEDRYFTPGSRSAVVGVPTRAGAVRVGLTICEDLWKGEDAGFASRYAQAHDPVAASVAAGAQTIVSPSASPFVVGKGARHRAILQQHAARHAVPVLSVNQLGGNDELVFDGHAFAYAPGGSLLAAARGFRDDLLVVDLASPPLPLPHDAGCVLLGDDTAQLFDALVLGVRDYLRKTGFTHALLGLSGGIDSALTAAVAAVALSPARVRGVALPSRYSSAHALADAKDLAQRLGITLDTIPIEPGQRALGASLDELFARIDQPPLGAHLPDLAEENLQSRLRGTLLMALSNRTGAMLLTTGNKSELAVGYCTLYGDMNGGLAVLADVSKQSVYALARWLNTHHARVGLARPPIPESSITKPPSAELRPNQTDQDSLPPYDVLDAIIEGYVERREDPDDIAAHAGLDPALAARVCRMIDLAEYKRKQTAVGIKVSSVAFGSGRRYPIAQRWRG